MAPKLRVRDVSFSERPVRFRQPFRFGAVTVEGAPELFVRVEIEVEGRGRGYGVASELMLPKWFNKDPSLSPEQTIDQLRRALALARAFYCGHHAFETAFALHADCYDDVVATCAKERIPALAAAFGPAEIDKAILDALLRLVGLDVFEGLKRNVAGIDARLTPDLDDAAIMRFLADRQPARTLFLRHTVGLSDPPEDLMQIVATTGVRYFKIKLSGDPAADRERWLHIASVLEPLNLDYRLTFDANEQFSSRDALAALVEALLHDEAFEEVAQRLIYIEQPMPSDVTWMASLDSLGKSFAFIIDEADSSYGAFPQALALGYRGVSSKSCKGLYKSLLNGARSARLNKSGAARSFITAEDLSCQAGLALQQDAALAAFHGIVHSERNGHHYGDGFGTAPATEARAFFDAHPDLYEEAGGQIRLAVRDGTIALESLSQAGFACAVDPTLIGPLVQAPNPSAKEYRT